MAPPRPRSSAGHLPDAHMTEIRVDMDIGKKRVGIDSNVCTRHAGVSETTVLPTSYINARARLPAMD